MLSGSYYSFIFFYFFYVLHFNNHSLCTRGICACYFILALCFFYKRIINQIKLVLLAGFVKWVSMVYLKARF